MRKFWKITKYFLVTVAAIFFADILVVVGFSVFHPKIEKADAIVILGAAINTPALYNRSMEGLRLYEEGRADVLVLSGGRISDKDISEAQYMQKVITRNSNSGKVPLMILEQDSHNTYENIKNSKAKIPDAKSVILVSDSFHMARAASVAKRDGFQDVYWSSPRPFYYQPHELIFYYFREVVAMISYIPKFVTN
jgi:uncharacterized SAM-binding protein YcdF (DUF218 family)